jgi:hypothetical protein
MDTAEPPLDGPGEESQLYCKPVAKKSKTTKAASSDDDSSADEAAPAPAAEPIDVDADDASDDANDLDRFGPRTEVDLRLGDAYASGVVVLAPEHEAWFNADVKSRLADLERAVSFAAAPAPYLLLVADENSGGGYRQLSHDGYRLTCCVRPRSAPPNP